MIAYLTDVEGQWPKLASFAAGNPHVTLAGDRLVLADGASFVFGGDAVDRGPDARRIVRALVAARREYGARVVLLAGNRDLNKLRFARELDAPPRFVPPLPTRGERLRWLLAHTMGAPRAFAYRAAELAAEAPDHAAPTDDAVADSYLAEVAPGGELRAYLEAAQLAHRAGSTLFVHGGVTVESFLHVPDLARATSVDAWLAGLDAFYRHELAAFAAGESPRRLIAYQAPVRGTHANQASVVYARPTDELGNPTLPDAATVRALRDAGIERVVVGHTPSGDSPALVRDDGFELVLGDNSYGRVEDGSQLAFTDDITEIRATAQLDDGTRVRVACTSSRHELASPLGRRDRRTGQLIKSTLDTGAYLAFRGLPDRQYEQRAVSAAELAAAELVRP